MKAMVFRRYGPPERLRLVDRVPPVPEAGEVLVAVRATSVNDWDWGLVRGRPYLLRLGFGLVKPRVKVPGAEVAGTVEAVGDRVTRFRPGDHVYGDISTEGLGGFAELVCVSEKALAPKPEAMTFEQAAALPHAAMLALQGLVDLGRIQPAERILINGAGGGVGTLGVQIAKRYETEVTGVDAGFKLEALRSMGFDHVLDYREVDFTRTGERYDLILDTRTNRSPFRYLRALRPRGRYVTVGGDLLRLLQIFCLGPLLFRAAGKRVRVLGLDPNKDLEWVNESFEEHRLEPVIDGVYPLSEAPRALEHFGAARHIGKIVITVSPPAPSTSSDAGPTPSPRCD